MRETPELVLACCCACISFGTVWLQSSHTTQPTEKDEETSSARAGRRRRKTTSSDHDRPASITDDEPKDAHQMLPTDSDSRIGPVYRVLDWSIRVQQQFHADMKQICQSIFNTRLNLKQNLCELLKNKG